MKNTEVRLIDCWNSKFPEHCAVVSSPKVVIEDPQMNLANTKTIGFNLAMTVAGLETAVSEGAKMIILNPNTAVLYPNNHFRTQNKVS